MRNLFGELVPTKKRSVAGPRRGKVAGEEPGCATCPLNTVRGVRKVLGLKRITGRKAMLWAQSPGSRENLKGLELIGPAGQFLWTELARVGLTREDFDVQNVIRCQPLDSHGQEHPPTKQELYHCSIHNEEAMARNRGQAVVHLILGKAAGKQLLGKAYRKDRPVVWHEPWGAYAVVADHPSYLLRLGGEKAGWAYYSFRDRLKAVKAILSHPGRWGYVLAQDYGPILEPDEMKEFEKQIYAEAVKGTRIGVDIEDGVVNEKPVVLMVGFAFGKYSSKNDWGSWKGPARSVVLHHPEASQKESRLHPLLKSLKKILEDPLVGKAFQHGSYDVLRLKRLLNIRVRGYEFDSQYATYLKHPHLRTYSLASMCNHFFQEFADYKQMPMEWSGNFANAPLKVLVPYNCADADLTKRLEVKTAPYISIPLLQVYIRVAFTLEDMETRGPYLDKEALAEAKAIVPKEIQKLHGRLQMLAWEGFNPNTPQQIAKLLFDKLKLPQLERRSTGKEILETLAQKTKSKVPRLVIAYRKLTKIESTYLKGYERSADAHNGQLHTIWWLTGAVTGRLRSGKGDQAEAKEGVINLQNLHGAPLLQNLLVSDPNWRLALGK